MKKSVQNLEYVLFFVIYLFLFSQAFFMHDSLVALISAFCGITYTILAGKGIPVCYPIGLTGSGFYVYLSFLSNLWGNLLLYLFYFIPMQIIGFFKWNNNLKSDKYEIIKTKLCMREKIFLLIVTAFLSFVAICILTYLNDSSPVIDGVTTIFSILGMYLTVKRCIEQWIVWMIVNGLSFLMWLKIAMQGIRVYSTITMWGIYFILAVYFYIKWSMELSNSKYNVNNY